MTCHQQARIVIELNEMYCMSDQQTQNHALGNATLGTFKKQLNNMTIVVANGRASDTCLRGPRFEYYAAV